jgi:hypothetical protein
MCGTAANAHEDPPGLSTMVICEMHVVELSLTSQFSWSRRKLGNSEDMAGSKKIPPTKAAPSRQTLAPGVGRTSLSARALTLSRPLSAGS